MNNGEMHYPKDTGCHLHPLCLECPEEKCIEERTVEKRVHRLAREIKRLRAAGWKIQQIAHKVGKSEETVYLYLRPGVSGVKVIGRGLTDPAPANEAEPGLLTRGGPPPSLGLKSFPRKPAGKKYFTGGITTE